MHIMETTAKAMSFSYLAPSAMSPSQSGYLQDRKSIIQVQDLHKSDNSRQSLNADYLANNQNNKLYY